MNIKKAKELANKHRFYLNEMIKAWMYDIKDITIPTLYFDNGEAIYTDSRRIVIGLAAYDKEHFNVKDEDEFLLYTLYFLGHEIQHCRSTPTKTWVWGQEEAFKMLCAKIYENINKTTIKFKTKKEAEKFIKDLNNTNPDLAMSTQSLQKVIHFIMNSLEDGRIERIRSNKRKTFKNQMIVIRGKEWNKNEVKQTKEEVPMLSILLNQILSLSTTSLYQKGFLDVYGETEAEDKVRNLFNNIGRGIIASSNRECMKHGIEICEKLAEDIIEYCKMSDLEKLMQQLMQQMQQSSSSIDENNEEGNSDNSSSSFGSSDIEIEMTEKEWEKQKNSSSNSSNGTSNNTVKVKIVDENGNDITDEVMEKEDEDTKGSSSKENDEDSDEKDENSGNSDNSDNDKGSKDSKNKEKNNSKDSSNNSSKKQSPQIQKTKANSGIGHLTNSGEEVDTDGIEEKIIEKMKKAAEEAMGEVAQAKKTSAMTKDPNASLVEDNSETPDVTSVNKSYRGNVHFVEYKRQYDVSEPLPADINATAEMFKKKIDVFFKNMQTIAIRGKKNGSLDSSNIHKLAMKQVNCFYKKAINFEFSGACYILCDNSGSMGYGVGSKRHEACKAMMMIEKAFADKMPLKMVAFDANGSNSVNHVVIKNWNERFRNSAAYNFSSKGPDGGCNKDGYSIRVATSELLKQVAKKKILIVLSDGLPSAYSGSGESDVSSAVDEARKQGIEVVSIYFPGGYHGDEETFKRMYKFNTITTEPQYITNELVKILKRFIGF